MAGAARGGAVPERVARSRKPGSRCRPADPALALLPPAAARGLLAAPALRVPARGGCPPPAVAQALRWSSGLQGGDGQLQSPASGASGPPTHVWAMRTALVYHEDMTAARLLWEE